MNNFKFLLNYFLKFFYKIFCFFTSSFKNKKKYLFYSFPDASDNSFYLYKFLSSYKNDLVFIWLCDEPENVFDKLNLYARSNKLVVVKKKSIKGFFHFCTSNYAFTTTNFYPFFVKGSGPTVIGVWHGMPIKVIGSYKDEGYQGDYFDYMVSTSDFYSEIIAKAFLIDKSKILPYGLPRNDGLLNPIVKVKDKIHEFFNIESSDKLIFWLPTYRKSFDCYGHNDSINSNFIEEWDSGFFSRLDSWALSQDLVVLIKLHPADSYNKHISHHDFKSLRLIKSQEWQNIGIDLYEALAVSDGLISDVSSVIIDYLIVKKPIAILSNAVEHYSRGIIPEAEPVLNSFFSIKSEADFKYFILNIDNISYPKESVLSKYNEQAITRQKSCKIIMNALEI